MLPAVTSVSALPENFRKIGQRAACAGCGFTLMRQITQALMKFTHSQRGGHGTPAALDSGASVPVASGHISTGPVYLAAHGSVSELPEACKRTWCLSGRGLQENVCAQ